MQKLPPVEEAKALFQKAAQEWGVWKWLTEKPDLRKAADKAWEALEEAEKKVRASWNADLKKAYRTPEAKGVDPEVAAMAMKLREADREANEQHMAAEETFSEAERRMSISMAREGSRQAIEAWEMREKVIRRFESADRKC